MSKEIAKYVGAMDSNDELIEERLKNIKIIKLSKNETNNLLENNNKEQIMKYQGITIHKNKNCTTWYTRFRKNGKQIYISARTQKECYNKLKKALLQNESNKKVIARRIITLENWYNEWLELYKIGKVKDTTIRCYNSAWAYIPIKTKKKEIKDIELKELIEILNNCKAERQKQNLYDLLNMLYKKAVDNDIIEKNLLSRIDKPKHIKNHGIALDNNQQKILIDYSKEDKNANILIFAMMQGLRRGEILGITWEDIDLNKNTLSINKAWSGDNKFTTTKNKQSIRTIPLFEESKKYLPTYTETKKRIFNITDRQLELIILKIREKTKISNLKIKDMRSTFITRCKELNIPKHIIQSWVGHTIGSTITDTVYTKHNKDIDDQYIELLNKSKFYSNSTQKKK